MKPITLPSVMFIVTLAASICAPAEANQKQQTRQFQQFNGSCLIERKDKGTSEDCDNMVVVVTFEDGYLSFQFHSKDKDPTGRYNWVDDFVGPGVSEVPEHDGKLFYMPADKLNFLDNSQNRQIVEKKYHDMGCLITFADSTSIALPNMTKLFCFYGDDHDRATVLTFTDIKKGQNVK
jgi:hypothetical protein